jgi:lambda family phage portal protein
VNLPAPIRTAVTLVRQTWDLWTGASSTSVLAWKGAQTGDRLSQWYPPALDFASYANPAILRSRARDAYRNNCWARRAVDLLVNYVCGIGLKPQLDLPDAALRARVMQLWGAWSEQADFSGYHSFAGLQGAAFRACLIDGECLALIRPGPRLKIQLLPGEFLAPQKDNAVDVGGGIQYNQEGQRIGYWLYDKIPPQALNPVPYFITADRVVHLFAPLQPGYERGVSWLAPALVPLYELGTFMETSLVRARTGSLFAGYIRSADGANVLAPAADPNAPPPFEPGTMARLRPGDEISFSTPPDPSQGYTPFIQTQLRAIAGALDVPYELLANDVSSVTFASGRHSLLAFERVCDALVQNLVAYQFCRPIWQWWVKIQVASGELPEEILAAPVRWIAPEFQTLDARMTTNSTLQKIRAGLMSRSEAVSSTGADPEALDEQIATDNARADKLGLIFDSDPRRVTLQGLEQPSEVNNGTSQTIQ